MSNSECPIQSEENCAKVIKINSKSGNRPEIVLSAPGGNCGSLGSLGSLGSRGSRGSFGSRGNSWRRLWFRFANKDDDFNEAR